MGLMYSVRSASEYSFALLSDIHIGDTEVDAVALATGAVSTINSMVSKYNIKFVFITGDLTNTALPDQWSEVRSILDELIIPYYPTIGNHDMWTYNSTWEEPTPTGDVQFAGVFGDRLSTLYNWNDVSVWNPEENITSCFQNWEMRVGNISFLSLDWNSRMSAATKLGYLGAWPGCQLHNFTGGTFQWLGERLSAIPSNIKTIILLQHQPFKAPPIVPDVIYDFPITWRHDIKELLLQHQPAEKYWGVFAGHYHIWWNGTAFDDWREFREWETKACKKDGAITVATVDNDSIVQLLRFEGNSTQISSGKEWNLL